MKVAKPHADSCPRSGWNSTALRALVLALSMVLLSACGGSSGSIAELPPGQENNNGNPQGPAPVVGFEVLNTFPHARDAFTQGLVFANGRLYESTGLVGQSTLREVDLNSGQVLRRVNNDPNVFAEGLALRAGRLVQLTLDSGVANVWNLDTLTPVGTLPSRVPAWGLAYQESADRFAFSDGSPTIHFLQPETFQELGAIEVTDNGQPVNLLNELEFVEGVLLANRFMTNEIVGIDPATGRVLFRANLSGIIDAQANSLGAQDVLNGIAYDETGDRLFVTGKRWPFLYQIRVVPVTQQ